MRCDSTHGVLHRTVNNAPTAQLGTLVDALCVTLQLLARSDTPQHGPLGTVSHVSAVVVCALRAQPQQAATAAAAAQKLVSAAQALVDRLAAQAIDEESAASCVLACLPMLQLQAGILRFHDACVSHDPSLDAAPPVFLLPAILQRSLPMACSLSTTFSSDTSELRCAGCMAEKLVADAHSPAVLPEGPLEQLACTAAGSIVWGKAAGCRHVLAQAAASGGAECCQWMIARLHDDRTREAHSLSCATGAQRRAISQVPAHLLAATSHTAALGLLLALPGACMHACERHAEWTDGAQRADIKLHVAGPLVTGLAQWLPHAAEALQKAVVKECMLASVDAATSELLHGIGAIPSTEPVAGFACSARVLSCKAASKVWPAAFSSIARRLQEDAAGAVAERIAAGCVPRCTQAQRVLERAAVVTRPAQRPEALLELMRATSGMLQHHAHGLGGAHCAARPGKVPRQERREHASELSNVLRCTQRLVSLVGGVNVTALAAFSKKRKWGLLARALIAIVCSGAAAAVMLQDFQAPEAARLQAAVVLSALQKLSMVVARLHTDTQPQLAVGELIHLATSCAHVLAWSDCPGIEDASIDLVQHVAMHALVQADCLGVACAWQHAQEQLFAGGSGRQVTANNSRDPKGSKIKTIDVPENKATKKRKGQSEHSCMLHGDSTAALPALLALEGLTRGVLLYCKQEEHIDAGNAVHVLLQRMEVSSADLALLCRSRIEGLGTDPRVTGRVDPAGWLCSVRVGWACCIHWASRSTQSQQDILVCIQVWSRLNSTAEMRLLQRSCALLGCAY